jgi:hypothetical protein
MKHPSIQFFIKPGMPLSVILVILYLGSWVLNFIHLRDVSYYSAASLRLLSPNNLWLISSILIITLLNLLLIAQLNTKFSIIRTRSFLPVFLYALFITAWKESHYLICSHVSLSVFLLSLMLFLGMYKNKKAVLPAFWGSMFISLTGILNPVYLFLMPIVWIGFAQLKSFSGRVFLASIMGVLIPWVFYFSFQFYTGNEILIFQNLFTEFSPNFLLANLILHERIYIAAIILIFIISLFGIYTNLLNDAAQNRKNLNFLVLLLIFLLLLIFTFAKHALAFLPMVAFSMAMLLAHPFTLNKSRFFTILFYLFCVMNVAYMFFNYYIIVT